MLDALQPALFLAGYWYWSRHAPRSFGYVLLALWSVLLLAILVVIGSGIWRVQLEEAPAHVIAIHHAGAEATVFLSRHGELMTLGWWCAWLRDRLRRFGLAVLLGAAIFGAAVWARSTGIVPPFEDEEEVPSRGFFWNHEVIGPALLVVLTSAMLVVNVLNVTKCLPEMGEDVTEQ